MMESTGSRTANNGQLGKPGSSTGADAAAWLARPYAWYCNRSRTRGIRTRSRPGERDQSRLSRDSVESARPNGPRRAAETLPARTATTSRTPPTRARVRDIFARPPLAGHARSWGLVAARFGPNGTCSLLDSSTREPGCRPSWPGMDAAFGASFTLGAGNAGSDSGASVLGHNTMAVGGAIRSNTRRAPMLRLYSTLA